MARHRAGHRECSNPVDVAELVRRLPEPGRQPIVGVARSRPGQRAHIDPAALARRLDGHAEVCLLPSQGARALPQSLNVHSGAARIWFAGVDLADESAARSHPWFLARCEADGEAAIEKIVRAVVRSEVVSGQWLTVDHRRRTKPSDAPVAEMLAAVTDSRREDAIVAVCPGSLPEPERQRLAIALRGHGRVFVLACNEDAQQVTAALPGGLGFQRPGIRVWWPGVGQRSSTRGHAEFGTDKHGMDLADQAAGFVLTGCRPLRIVKPSGEHRDLSVGEMTSILYDEGRTRLVIGVGGDRRRPCVDPVALADAVGAGADVVLIPTSPQAARLTAALPESLGIGSNAVRLWLPGLTRSSHPYDHPFFRSAHTPETVLIAHVAEAVKRRIDAPSAGERSDPQWRARVLAQRVVQRKLDRFAANRRTTAAAAGLACCRHAAKRGQRKGAVAAWEDVATIVLASRGEGSAEEVFLRSDVAKGWYEVGQEVGGRLRAQCFERSLAYYEQALAVARSIDEQTAPQAGVELTMLLTMTAEQCRYVAQRRGRERRPDVWEAIDRGIDLYDEAIVAIDDPERRAWALLWKAQLLADLPTTADAPRLSAHEEALRTLHDAMRSFTGTTDYRDLSADAVGSAENRRMFAAKLLGLLGEMHGETGDIELARVAFQLLEGYEDSKHKGHIRASLQRGRLELDHGDFWTGVTRLERELAKHRIEDLTGRTHELAIMAIQALSVVLRRHYAYRESDYYAAWAERLGKPARTQAADASHEDAPAGSERRHQVGWSSEAAADRPPRSVASAHIDRLAALLTRALAKEEPRRVVTVLRSLSERLWKTEADPARLDGELSEPLAQARAVLEQAQAWQPRRRVARHVGIPAAWFELPADMSKEPRRAAIACLLLCLQFAELYLPAQAPSITRELIGRIVDVHGFIDEIRILSLDAAKSAAEQGRWHDAVRAYLRAARSVLDASPQQTAELARQASDQLQWGLTFIGFGRDRARVIDLHQKSALRVVELMLRADASPRQVFEAVDRAKGQVLMATRASTTPDFAGEEAVTELRELQLAELDLHLADGSAPALRRRGNGAAEPQQPDDDDAAARRRSFRREQALWQRIAAARRRLLRVAPETVHAFGGQDEPATIDTLRAQHQPTAIIQYVTIEGNVYACAVLGGEGHDVSDWCCGKPIASAADIDEVGEAMWDDILHVSGTLGADASFEDGFEIMLGAGDGRSGQTLASFCEQAETIVIVPCAHGSAATARMPFHALSDGGVSLVERHHVLYAPSAAFWTQSLSREQAASTGGALAIGTDGEIGALAECSQVAAVVQQDGRLRCEVVEEECDVRRVLLSRERGASIEYDILHVAAHGRTVGFPNHMDSALEFGEVQVSARDWLLSGTRAHLAFVNSCHVGHQVGRAGDLYGIPFAALGSGSASTVFASAPVEPRHATLFAQHYHERVQAGDGRLQACSAAMRAAIASGGGRSAWAPYFISGDPRPLPRGEQA